MRLIIFGIGMQFFRYRNELPKECRIVTYWDSDVSKQGSWLDGIPVCSPQNVDGFLYDKIILFSDAAVIMRQQLLKMGISKDKLIHYRDFLACYQQKLICHNVAENTKSDGKKKILIMTYSLGLHGSAIAAMRLAKAMTGMGCSVTLAASDGDVEFIQQIRKQNINVVICPYMEHKREMQLRWTDDFDVIIANTFLMIRCGLEIGKVRTVFLWLHENSDAYSTMEYWREEIEEGLGCPNLRILAASQWAKDCFLQAYPFYGHIQILEPYCDDIRETENYLDQMPQKMNVGLIGSFCTTKGQDILLDAISILPDGVRLEICFWFIGKNMDTGYGESIKTYINYRENCIAAGELSQRKMYQMYGMLDVVVVPSREETLSLAAIEGMSCEKPCIVSDKTGIASYIEDGKSGLVFESENTGELAKLLMWAYQHREQMKMIGKAGREIYQGYFTEEIFRKRLKTILDGM